MLTVQIESFEACASELEPIFQIHWQELAIFKDRMPLAPQWDEYFQRERDGRLFLTTVRLDGKIVGYWTVQIAPGFHYATTLTAHTDVIYVTPEVRDRGIVLPLYRRVKSELQRRGVSLWYAGHKSHNPLGMDRLLPMLGFQPADCYFAQWLGTDDPAQTDDRS